MWRIIGMDLWKEHRSWTFRWSNIPFQDDSFVMIVENENSFKKWIKRIKCTLFTYQIKIYLFLISIKEIYERWQYRNFNQVLSWLPVRTFLKEKWFHFLVILIFCYVHSNIFVKLSFLFPGILVRNGFLEKFILPQ